MWNSKKQCLTFVKLMVLKILWINLHVTNNPENHTCIDLIMANWTKRFQISITTKTEPSDFHKMTTTILKSYFKKQNPKLIVYRKCENYDNLFEKNFYLNSVIYYQMKRIWKVFKVLLSKFWIILLHWIQNMFNQMKRLSLIKNYKKASKLRNNF